MYGTYAERALRVARYLQDASPQQFGDLYAALRHALFLTDVLLAGVELDEPDVPLAEEGKPGPLDPLTRLSLFEFAWGQALRSGWHPTPDLINHLTHGERAALLRGAVRSQVAVDTDILLDQIGMSDTTDALIRDAMAVWTTTGPLADLAVDPDLSAMGLDDVFDNGEAKAGSAQLSGAILVHPVEALENSVDVFHRYADSRVGYRYFD